MFRDLNIFKAELKLNPHEIDNCGETALHWAVLTGKINILKYLLEDCHCNVAMENAQQQTVLHLAASDGNFRILQYLVNWKKPVLSVDIHGLSPLHYAILLGNLEITRLFLKKYNISVQQLIEQYVFMSTSSKFSSVQATIAKGNVEMLEYFTTHAGAFIRHDSSLLILAVPHKIILQQLLKNVYASDSIDHALEAAIYGGHLQSVKYLLELQYASVKSGELREKIVEMLVYASKCGSPEIVDFYLQEYSKSGFDKSSITWHFTKPLFDFSDDNTSLHYAARLGKYKMVKYLVNKHKCDPNIRGTKGRTPVHVASCIGNLNIVRYLIEDCNCSPTTLDDEQVAPLDMAVRNGHLDIMKYLHEVHHCEFKGVSSKFSPLLNAIQIGDKSIIQYLIKKKYYDPTSECADNKTSLICAAKMGKLHFLIHHGFCNPLTKLQSSFSLLNLTVFTGHFHEVKYLVEDCQIDPNVSDDHGRISVDYATLIGDLNTVKYFSKRKDFEDNIDNVIIASLAIGHLHIVQYLMETFSYPVNQVFQPRNFLKYLSELKITPLTMASSMSHLEILKYLIEDCNGDPTLINEFCGVPVHYASKHGQFEVLQYLVESHNCNPFITDCNAMNALHHAISIGHFQIVKYLINYKTLFNQTEINILISCAANFGQLPILKHFLEEMCYQYDDSQNEINPLHKASLNGHIEVVKYLIENRYFDPNAPNKQDHNITALTVACLSGHLHIIKYLKNEQKCDFENEESKIIALFSAIHNGHLYVVEYLMENYNYKEDVVDELNRTPIQYAVCRGRLLIVKYFMEKLLFNINENKIFCMAIEGDHLPILRYLIERYKTLFNGKSLDSFILYYGIKAGRAHVVQYLIKEQIYKPTITFANGYNILQAASYFGLLEIVELLIEEYACDPYAIDKDSFSPLLLAASAGQLKVVEYFLNKKVCIPNKANNNEQNLLHYASCFGWLSIVNSLIKDYTYNPEDLDSKQLPPLYYAVCNGHISVVRYLIKHVNPCAKLSKGTTPLHVASTYGHLEVVKYLIEECKCPTNSEDDFGKTPVYYSVLYNHMEVLKYYINYPIENINAGVPHSGNLLMVASFKGHLKIVQYLIEDCHFDPTAKNSLDDASIHIAALGEQLNILQYLIREKKCDPNVRGHNNHSLVYCATIVNNINMVKYLVEHCDCDPMTRNDFGSTPLHYSSNKGYLELVKYFTALQSDSTLLADHLGNTPLHQAAKAGKIDVVRYFIDEAEVNFNIANNQGMSPLKLARYKEQWEVVDYLSLRLSDSFDSVCINESALQSSTDDTREHNNTTYDDNPFILMKSFSKNVSLLANTEQFENDISSALQSVLTLSNQYVPKQILYIPDQVQSLILQCLP